MHNAYTAKYGSLRVCHGYSTKPIQSPAPAPGNLQQHIERIPQQASSWCIQNFEATDNGDTIAAVLKDGTAIAVCDGSFKNGIGTSTWVIEGTNSNNRIKGWNWVPEDIMDQSPYRSEVAGILGVVSMVQEIFKLNHIANAKITIACDNISALHQALNKEQPITSKHLDHDLLLAIRKKMKQFTIQWLYMHIRGKQDEKKMTNELNHLEVLNVEMDLLAKKALSTTPLVPPIFDVDGCPWSIWIDGKK